MLTKGTYINHKIGGGLFLQGPWNILEKRWKSDGS